METTMPVAAAIGGSVISAVGQSRAAKKAAAAQTAAANQDIAFQTETRDLIRNDLAPYRNNGGLAQQAIDFELGLGARPMVGGQPMAIETIMPSGPVAGPAQPAQPTGNVAVDPLRAFRGAINSGGDRGGTYAPMNAPAAAAAPAAAPMYRVGGQTFSTMEEAQAYANANAQGGTPYGGFRKTPGYDFRLQQGQDSIEASAAARGGLYSGAAMRDLLKFGQDYGSAEYGNYLSRLGARADTGMNAATMSGNASQAAAGAVGNAFGNIGNAQSAGAIGRANALSGGLENIVGAWNYQSNLNKGLVPGGWTAGPSYGGGR